MQVEARLSHSHVRFDSENNAHLVVTLKAPKVDITTKRPPVCIVMVADLSTSMSEAAHTGTPSLRPVWWPPQPQTPGVWYGVGGYPFSAPSTLVVQASSYPHTKLDYAKQSMAKLVEHLAPGDYCGLVTFDDDVRVVYEPTEMTEARKFELKGRIASLQVSGCTNLSGGIEQGLNLVNRIRLPEGVLSRTITFTDGLPNRGTATTRPQLLGLIQKALGRATASFFGFGTDADQDLMADMAKEGRGNYAFIRNPEDSLAAFGKELGGLLSMYAKNINVRLSPWGEHKITGVVSRVESSFGEQYATITVPEILGEEERHIVVSLKLAKQSQPLPRPLNVVNVTVEYDRLDDGQVCHTSTELKTKINFVKPGEEVVKIDPALDKIIGTAELVVAQDLAEKCAKIGNYSQAVAVMNSVRTEFMERGLDMLAYASASIGSKLTDAGAYNSNQGYLKTMSGGMVRAFGVSSYDAGAAADLNATIGCSVANSSQVMYTQSFVGGALGSAQGQGSVGSGIPGKMFCRHGVDTSETCTHCLSEMGIDLTKLGISQNGPASVASTGWTLTTTGTTDAEKK